MKYYKFSYSCDTKDTGPVFPQTQRMKDHYDYNSSDSIHALARFYKGFPDFIPNLDGFVLHGRAKLSDIVSNGMTGSGILLSEKTKGVLEKCNLVGCKFFDATVYYRKNAINYYWMHVISHVRPSVVFEKSKFFIYKNLSKKLDYIDIASEEDLMKKRNTLEENNPGQIFAIWAETIVFDSSFNKNNDFFMVGIFDGDFYVSERLRNLFDEFKITGAEFEIADNIILS